MRRSSWVFDLKPALDVDMREDPEAAERLDEVEAINHRVLTPRGGCSAVDDFEPPVELREGIQCR